MSTGCPAASNRPRRGPSTQAAAREANPPTCSGWAGTAAVSGVEFRTRRQEVQGQEIGRLGRAGRGGSSCSTHEQRQQLAAQPHHVDRAIPRKVVDPRVDKQHVATRGRCRRAQRGDPAPGRPDPVGHLHKTAQSSQQAELGHWQTVLLASWPPWLPPWCLACAYIGI